MLFRDVLLIVLDLYHLGRVDAFRPCKTLLMWFKVEIVTCRTSFLTISTGKSKYIFLIQFYSSLLFKTLDMIDLHVLTLNTFINEIILEEHLRSLIKLTIILRSISIFVNIWHQEWICPVLLCSIQVVTECLGVWVDISRPT